MIDKEDVEAIADLERITREQGISMMIIGAAARLLLLDWRHRLPVRRTTKDWDLAVRMESWNQYDQLRHRLTETKAPFSRTSAEHRLQHRSGALIDLLPFGAIEAPEGAIQWPESRAVMSVIGFREAEEHATSVELVPGLGVKVVTIPTLVMLKLIAYSDRRRSDDLADVLFILEQYSHHELEDRIFEELADQLARGDLAFEQAGAFLLGRDVSRQCHPSNLPKLSAILNDILGHEAILAELVSPRFDDEIWERRFESVTALFRTFRDGLLAIKE